MIIDDLNAELLSDSFDSVYVRNLTRKLSLQIVIMDGQNTDQFQRYDFEQWLFGLTSLR